MTTKKPAGIYYILEFLEHNKPNRFTTKQISEHFGANLTSINRKVKKLADKNIINREKLSLKGNGCYFNRYWVRE